MSTSAPPIQSPSAFATGTWRLDPSRSSVEFHVRHFFGLITVKGRFEQYEATLDASRSPEISLIVEASSLDTKNARRDKHLRSGDFFDVEHHPRVRFEGDAPVADGEAFKVRGVLDAAGARVPVEADATIAPVGDELEIGATALVDHRKLGMTWSPLGILRSPSKLVVRGRLTRVAGA